MKYSFAISFVKFVYLVVIFRNSAVSDLFYNNYTIFHQYDTFHNNYEQFSKKIRIYFRGFFYNFTTHKGSVNVQLSHLQPLHAIAQKNNFNQHANVNLKQLSISK